MVYLPASSRSVIAICILVIVTGPALAAPRLSLKKLVADADALAKEGRLEEAANAYRRILFIEPKYRKATSRLNDVLSKQVAPLIKKSEEKWKDDREYALRLLRDAFRIHRRSKKVKAAFKKRGYSCLLYTSPSPRDQRGSRMPSSA